MKDSGIPWIGEIPENWTVKKLKYCSTVLSGYPFESANFTNTNGFPLIRIRDITSGEIETYYLGEYDPTFIVRKNDILIGMDGDFNVRWWNNVDALLNQRCCKITPLQGYSKRYLFYCLPLFLKRINDLTYSTTVKHLSVGDIFNSFIPDISLNEQSRIVASLDTECARIDAVMEQTRASIEEYKKLKQSIITEAVTKGIRPNRPMKDSGIDWIGQIPEDWEVRRIKTLFDLRDEKNYLPLEEVNLISLYTDLGVVQHADLEKTTGNKASNADGYKKVYEDDIIVNIILCWMGAIGRSAYEGVTSPAYDIYIPKEKVDSRFYHHYFRTTGFSGDCYKRGKGIMAMRWRTYSDQFCDIKVVYPSYEEQQDILKYLDHQSAAIDDMIASKQHLLEELESYKKSLIYEYVTGKKEVL